MTIEEIKLEADNLGYIPYSVDDIATLKKALLVGDNDVMQSLAYDIDDLDYMIDYNDFIFLKIKSYLQYEFYTLNDDGFEFDSSLSI